MGSSGSGKSVLLNILGALDRPTSEKVFINGLDIFALGNAQIATMRNLLIGPSEANFRSMKILEYLGIADKAKQKPANLVEDNSKGLQLQDA